MYLAIRVFTYLVTSKLVGVTDEVGTSKIVAYAAYAGTRAKALFSVLALFFDP